MTKLYIAGHHGMVGSALVRRFRREPGVELLLRDRKQLDLTSQSAVAAFLTAEKPDVAIIAAAKVGGIHANNTFPAEFLHDNLAIAASAVHGAWKAGVKRLLFLGSSCIYPKHAAQPMTEDCLLTGPLEPTNEAYAIAKIAGLKLCQYYRKQYGVDYHSAMPTNLYGPGDNYDLETGHVLAALIRKAHEAKRRGAAAITIWGTGAPRREFLHVDDCADALVCLMQTYSGAEPVNVGTGQDISILELARLVCRVVGLEADVARDETKPDGTPRKLLDVSRLAALGWSSRIALEDGIAATYQDFLTRGEVSAD